MEIIVMLLVIAGIIGIIFLNVYFLGTTYKTSDEGVMIRSGLAKIEILYNDIIEVRESEAFAGEKGSQMIGLPMGNPDRLVIKTTRKSYVVSMSGSKTLARKIKENNPKVEVVGSF
ncbi:hypothetical protein Q73_14215 [Bacillus coahuilensis m2-6]|uniref:SunI/YnzG family protein n=1 Tax=Bacillus coahuilensis TaxID=408580 RepID=UPI000750336F|nr:hypothetical protein [Bacillus coahuilensis]KUP04988.1 hypothetical protein Q73_14215 [Bacillus coahuilensis m2-6]